MSMPTLISLTISYFSDIFLTPVVRKITALSLCLCSVSRRLGIFLTI